MWADARQLLSGQKQSNDDVMKLMAFKSFSVTSDPHGALANWTDDSPTPCSWLGVSCSLDGRVVALNLSYAGLVGALHLPNLTALSTLRHLYLRGNSFSAADLSASTAVSCNLETLDLSSNVISNPLPPQSFFSACNSLAYVNLSRNSIPGGSLAFSPSLLQLDVSRNRISDSALLNYSLSNCQNLNLLNFSDNKLTGKLGVAPLSCKNLIVLDLSYNFFSGSIPSSFMPDSLVSLKHLDLSHNNFSGNFSSLNFGQCINLTWFSLSQNSLLDSAFPTSLRNCHLLEVLDLSHIGLEGKIPGGLFGNFKNLMRLSLSHNQFTGGIPRELGQACGTLQDLDLSSNKLTGGLPQAFTSCSSMQVLNLANNLLSGDFLDEVVSTLPSLRYLYVAFNNISGFVPLSLANCTQLQVLDLSSNGFTGNVPAGLCSSTSPLAKILLANNYLSGSVPVELGNCKRLRTLDLSFNSLSGPIPLDIWKLPNLSDLVMWANNLTGEIPEGICVDGGNLETLILNNNLITGSIPQSIAKCTNMIWVSLSSNHLTGEIPPGIGNLLKLAILQLGNNSLTGQIPPELGKCQSLIWLDLNSNDISGVLPPELANQAGLVMPGIVSGKQFAFVRNEGGTACRGAGGLVEFEGIRAERLESFPMVHSCSSTRIYSGMTVYTFANNGSMIYLDVSYNNLEGSIPENFGAMSYLQVLNLGHNKLMGHIPDSFGGLKAIGVLDLSHNDLQGYLPGSLGTLTFLSDLDVSNNKLTGPIPTGGSSIWKLSSVPEPLSINIATFEKPLRKLTFAHLLEATNGFSAESLIGSGGFGEVYKAQLRDGCVVAIKKLIHITGQGDREFMAEMETIGKIKHRNLVPLLGYCKVGEERLLVYEYMKWGSLDVSTLAGTPGYVPPEYYQSFRYPSEFGDDNNLVGWAKQLYRERRIDEILDPELMTQKSGALELQQYLKIAFECLDDRPFRRPTMIQVMAMFKELQVDSESDILDGFSLKDNNVIEES
ncbi:hypothetical protein COLO4_07797 [Corchorus olitorius]|uniref:non-specific serine/threonine protein kinase n=1 Tax=Corchorus olitorius TaxID=93759 RepID=A0A1R3KIN6_9ROSI|nr:hypothetical protein COLO4_07797 [Corchorus olitorius]